MLNDYRYLLMRIIRLLLTVFFELLAFAALAGGVIGFLMCAAWLTSALLGGGYAVFEDFRPSVQVILRHPFLFTAVVVPVFFLSLAMAWASALPYRFKWKTPGLAPKVCRKCHKVISDSFNCPECKAFRPARIATAFVQMLNLALCGAWVVHDCIMWMFAICL